MISFISLFKNINAVVSNQKVFFWTAVSVTYVAAVNTDGTTMFLANGVSTFFINGKPTYINSL